MKFFKKDTPLGLKQRNQNRRIISKTNDRVNHLRRKLTRGAANIFRTIKVRAKWGNKQLWGSREKGKPGLPTDKSRKQK